MDVVVSDGKECIDAELLDDGRFILVDIIDFSKFQRIISNSPVCEMKKEVRSIYDFLLAEYRFWSKLYPPLAQRRIFLECKAICLHSSLIHLHRQNPPRIDT